MNLTNLFMVIEQFVYVLGACATVQKIFDHEPKLKNLGTEKINDVKGKISLRNVHHAYPSKPDVTVLKDITIDISQNRVIAIVGHSGSGKSSIISLIERFYDPYQG